MLVCTIEYLCSFVWRYFTQPATYLDEYTHSAQRHRIDASGADRGSEGCTRGRWRRCRCFGEGGACRWDFVSE